MLKKFLPFWFTPLGLLNMIIFQWFGIRLTKIITSDWLVPKKRGYTDMFGNFIETLPMGRTKVGQWTSYCFMYWVLPLTGWYSDFIPSKRKYTKESFRKYQNLRYPEHEL